MTEASGTFRLPSGYWVRQARKTDAWAISWLGMLANAIVWSSTAVITSSMVLLVHWVVTGSLQASIFPSLLALFIGLAIPLLVLVISMMAFLAQRGWVNCWVVEFKSRLVALAHFRRARRHSVLEFLYVAPKHRHRKVGSCLVQRIVREVPKPLFVACVPRLVGFYTRLGFAPCVASEATNLPLRTNRFSLTFLVLTSQQPQTPIPDHFPVRPSRSRIPRAFLYLWPTVDVVILIGLILFTIRNPDPDRFLAAIYPNSAEMRLNLGRRFLLEGKLEAAIAEYRTSLRLNPNLALTHVNLGYALEQLSQLDEAIAQYRIALRLNPNDSSTYSRLGFALATQENLEEAIEAYQTAISLDSNNAITYSNLGVALRKQGDLSGAIAAYQQAVRLNPKDWRAFYGLGLAWEKMRQQGDAIAAYQEAIRINPDDRASREGLERILRSQGN